MIKCDFTLLKYFFLLQKFKIQLKKQNVFMFRVVQIFLSVYTNIKILSV